MADYSSRLPLQDSLNRVATERVASAMQSTGWTLPCHVIAVSGALVTVRFDVDSQWDLPDIQVPKLESPWIRMPTQDGDKGIVRPASVYLGGVSGLGGGTAGLATPANLSALVFEPVSNAGSGPIDQNAAQVQGPNGAIIRTTTGTESQIVTDANGTTVTYGSNTLTINASTIQGTVGSSSMTITSSSIVFEAGGVPVTIDASGLNINGILFGQHKHPYIPGSGTQTDTGNPV